MARTAWMRGNQAAPAVSASTKCVGWAQLTMKYSTAPSVAVSTVSTASPSGMPDGSRPSVSVVNPIAIGMPAATQARTMPIASST